jgi:hypothetical protein
MKLELRRTYYTDGTNGTLLADNRVLCSTIERAWSDNQRLVSCIPEGKYTLVKRYTEHLGQHLQVMDVPGRDMILIHPANDALMELKGCIAPVMKLQAPGKGSYSREALNIVLQHVQVSLKEKQVIYLVITKEAASVTVPTDNTGNQPSQLLAESELSVAVPAGKQPVKQVTNVPMEAGKRTRRPALLRQMIFSPEIKKYANNY